MQLDPQKIGAEAMYKLMIGCVVPRPIAWVSSVDADGVPNLAPFSYFMAITHDPPTIAFSSSPRSLAGGGRGKKDTLRNIEATREFVVNVVDDALAEQISGDLGSDGSASAYAMKQRGKAKKKHPIRSSSRATA